MRRPTFAASLLAAVVLLLFATARSSVAAEWDLVYANHFDVTLCPDGCGITLGNSDCALLVNTGSDPITVDEFESAAFEVTASLPDLSLTPFVNHFGALTSAIQPQEAVGGVTSLEREIVGPNDILLTQLLPGETHRNTFGRQVLPVTIKRPVAPGLYEGPVRFEVRMTMAGRRASFTVDVDVHLGPYKMLFLGASRVSSVPLATPAGPTTWGRIKSAYR